MSHSDVITISDLRVDCVVGVFPEERYRVQPLELDIDLVLDTERAATSERLSRTADYHAISAEITFLLQSCRFRLLETAAHAIARYLLAPPTLGEKRPAVDEVRVRLTKPGALRGKAIPSLEIRRPASWVEFGCETKPFGTVDVIHETKDAGIYRLNISPHNGIPLHEHRVMHESELVLTEGLRCQDKSAPRGTVFRWPHGAAHRYDNPTDRWQTILCVDSPPFIEDDEREVDGEPDDIAPVRRGFESS